MNWPASTLTTRYDPIQSSPCLRYAVVMGRWCTVTVTDGEGKRYSLDVNASSSYDAAHLYLTHVKEQPACGFFDTDATAGENWLGCTAANTWTVLGKRHEKGITAPVNCTLGDVFFDTDATAEENWLGCTAANTWTLPGTPSTAPSRLLSWQKQSSATTLIGGETVIASTLVPGGTIPSGACLKFRAGFQHTTGTATVEYRIRYGGSYLTALPSTPNTQIVRLEGFMCNDPGSTGAQQIAAGYMLSTTNSAEQMTTMAVDSTVDQMFSLAAVGPATDAITLRYFLVEVLK